MECSICSFNKCQSNFLQFRTFENFNLPFTRENATNQPLTLSVCARMLRVREVQLAREFLLCLGYLLRYRGDLYPRSNFAYDSCRFCSPRGFFKSREGLESCGKCWLHRF